MAATLARVELKDVKQEHSRFLINQKDFSKQYSHIYDHRSKQMREGLSDLVKRQWGAEFPIAAKIIDTESNADEYKNAEVALVGILYKEMGLRASVLDEFKEHGGISQGITEKIDNYMSEDDFLILEDESGRVSLDGEIVAQLGQLVTGIMVAVRGSLSNDGKFHVSELLSLGLAGQNPVKPPRPSSSARAMVVPNPQSKFVMLVSGLGIGGGNARAALQTQLLVDFLCGRLGGANDAALASRVGRVIVCGNSVLSQEKLHGAAGKEPQSWSVAATKASVAKQAQDNIAPVRELDALLAQGLMTVPIDLMPGSDDPGVFTMPQQPLHPCLLPQATRFSSLSLVSNPYQISAEGGIVLTGHSGAPVADIARQTSYLPEDSCEGGGMQVDPSAEATEEDTEAAIKTKVERTTKHHLQILLNTLRWGHLAPTAPDSLPCYPFESKDPFILPQDHAPHVVFSGSAPGFATDLYTTLNGHICRAICVPRFAETGTAVLVDIESLDVSTIEFGVN